MRVFVLVCFVSLSLALPLESGVQTLLADPPAVVPKPDPPQPDQDGMLIEQVVNVHKKAVVLVHSESTEIGAQRRQLIRDSWLQPLNRSSPFAFDSETRRSVTVWFVVANDTASHYMSTIEEEGRRHGDMLLVNPPPTQYRLSEQEEFGSLLRWVRVAYFQKYDYVVLTEDDSYVSLYNLVPFCEQHKDTPFFYGGFVNSFELAPKSYQHKYYAPFVQRGTIVLSALAVELVARELGTMLQLDRVDASLGHFLAPFTLGKPTHSSQFVGDFKKTYSSVANPIIINHVDADTCKILSTPVVKDGKITWPAMPPQAAELKSTFVYVDPHPKDNEPSCDALTGGGCKLSNIKLMDEEKVM